MCSHYQAVKDAERLHRHFNVGSSVTGELDIKTDMWPGYLGSFIRSHPHAEVGDEAVPLAELGAFYALPVSLLVRRFWLSFREGLRAGNSSKLSPPA